MLVYDGKSYENGTFHCHGMARRFFGMWVLMNSEVIIDMNLTLLKLNTIDMNLTLLIILIIRILYLDWPWR